MATILRTLSVSLIPFIFISCASTPLTYVDRQKVGKVKLNSTNVDMPNKATYTSASAEASRASGAAFGLIGAVMAESMAAISESGGQGDFNTIRKSTGNFEQSTIYQKTRSKLSSRGYLSSGSSANTMTINVTKYGLYKNSDNMLSPFINAGAKIKDSSGKTLWSNNSEGVASVRRSWTKYKNSPSLYKQDFSQAVSVWLKNLIDGTDAQNARKKISNNRLTLKI